MGTLIAFLHFIDTASIIIGSRFQPAGSNIIKFGEFDILNLEMWFPRQSVVIRGETRLGVSAFGFRRFV